MEEGDKRGIMEAKMVKKPERVDSRGRRLRITRLHGNEIANHVGFCPS
jgi:hypothetical protein